MRRIIFVLLLLTLPVAAFAQNFELTPFVGYRFGGEIAAGQTDLFSYDVDIADSPNFGITFDIPLTNFMQMELMVDHQATNFEVDGGLFGGDENLGDVDLTYYHAGLLFEFDRRDVRPFVVVSAGLTNIAPDFAEISSETRFSGSIGGGAKIPITRNFGLRLEGRGFWTSIDGSSNDDDCFRCQFEYDEDLYQTEVKLGFMFEF